MKILFLCKGNVARSQAAEAFLKRASNHEVRSAGTSPSKLKEWQTVEQVEGGSGIIEAMNEEGIDISQNRRKIVSEEDIQWADRIYIMADKESVPEFVLSKGNVEFWDIDDPKGKSLEDTRRLVAQIKEKVSGLNI